ncbi:Bax inhibitor-1/YccA family protein [Helicovermis profundi]|uniref:Bax inhibitor-1/YccA family protein n=1 Tax=Helicovermis profundi TaxID=3065157 RepID=A0AAU9EBJ2_9FIRM|nr:Bax inhibitor-1/YccA family protein [Clostridia bacterium S502]
MNDFVREKSDYEIEGLQRSFINKVFLWMAIALSFTGVVSLYTVNSPWLLRFIFSSNITFSALIGLEFFAVWKLTRSLSTMSAAKASIGLVLYSVLNGLTLSSIFLMYTSSSIAMVLFISAGMFGSMFMIGMTIKADLSKMRSILFMGLIGIILASVANIFMRSSFMYTAISYIGVLIFCGLTMYDASKLKAISLRGINNDELMQKYVIAGALMLYLDFINLFLFLLRIMGRRK